MHVVGFSGGLNAPSRTFALVESIVNAFPDELVSRKTLIDFALLATSFGSALCRESLSQEYLDILTCVENADVLVIATPVYRAAYPGLVKHFFDLIDRKGLEHKPVILAANGASAHHALIIESHLRPLFSSLGAFTTPTGIYSQTSDFTDYKLTHDATLARASSAVVEAMRVMKQA